MDRHASLSSVQLGFVDGVCTEIYQIMAKFSPVLQPLLDGCLENRARWVQMEEEEQTEAGKEKARNLWLPPPRKILVIKVRRHKWSNIYNSTHWGRAQRPSGTTHRCQEKWMSSTPSQTSEKRNRKKDFEFSLERVNFRQELKRETKNVKKRNSEKKNPKLCQKKKRVTLPFFTYF